MEDAFIDCPECKGEGIDIDGYMCWKCKGRGQIIRENVDEG